MPNGNPDFNEKELPALEAFFSPLADVLNGFGARYNLMLDRYYHQFPSWRFNFRHPQGGLASLEVMKDSEDSIKIHLYWWIDDYDKFTRSSRTGETPSYEVNGTDMAQILEEQLRRVLSWGLGEWSQFTTGFEQAWKSRGRRWLQEDVKRYPLPKV